MTEKDISLEDLWSKRDATIDDIKKIYNKIENLNSHDCSSFENYVAYAKHQIDLNENGKQNDQGALNFLYNLSYNAHTKSIADLWNIYKNYTGFSGSLARDSANASYDVTFAVQKVLHPLIYAEYTAYWVFYSLVKPLIQECGQAKDKLKKFFQSETLKSALQTLGKAIKDVAIILLILAVIAAEVLVCVCTGGAGGIVLAGLFLSIDGECILACVEQPQQ